MLPENDIAKIQANLKGNMILMGGIDAAKTDYENAPEEAVRAETRRVCQSFVPGGHFIPSITSGGPNSIHRHIDPIIADEISRYEKESGL